MSGDVHAIRYRWSESSLVGTRGMGPVETSLPPDRLPVWDRRLRDHVWAASAEPGFTFVVCDGVGALIRKHATHPAEGRPGSHAQALIGERLTAAAAVGLTCWEGWDDLSSKPLDAATLTLAADRGLEEVRLRARALPPGRLAGLFAQLMALPSASYTVLEEPDPLAVICAFGDLLGQFPTFASDESDDTGAGLPTAVFLRSVGFSSTIATRRRLGTSALDDLEVSAFAAAAVEAYITDGLAGISVLRRDRPPADLGEVREWARRSQYAPGILRDLAMLPRLRPDDLAKLTIGNVLARIKDDVSTAPASRLIRVLDRSLPDPVKAVVVREAIGRVTRGPDTDALLDRLAELAPLPADWIAVTKPVVFASVARITRRLLTPADREGLLRSAAQGTSIPALILWIDDHAKDDRAGALAVYSALLGRLHHASKEDVRVLVSRRVLSDAVRRFTDSEEDSADALADLLGALPRGALRQEDVIQLSAPGDPALLAALASVADQHQPRSRRRWFSSPANPRHSSANRKTK
jgi:hypothetical protein